MKALSGENRRSARECLCSRMDALEEGEDVPEEYDFLPLHATRREGRTRRALDPGPCGHLEPGGAAFNDVLGRAEVPPVGLPLHDPRECGRDLLRLLHDLHDPGGAFVPVCFEGA